MFCLSCPLGVGGYGHSGENWTVVTCGLLGMGGWCSCLGDPNTLRGGNGGGPRAGGCGCLIGIDGGCAEVDCELATAIRAGSITSMKTINLSKMLLNCAMMSLLNWRYLFLLASSRLEKFLTIVFSSLIVPSVMSD